MVSQFLFALIVPRSNPCVILIDLAVAGVIKAGIWQSVELMDEMKMGYLANVALMSMFYGQLIGSVVNAFVASGVYTLFRQWST